MSYSTPPLPGSRKLPNNNTDAGPSRPPQSFSSPRHQQPSTVDTRSLPYGHERTSPKRQEAAWDRPTQDTSDDTDTDGAYVDAESDGELKDIGSMGFNPPPPRSSDAPHTSLPSLDGRPADPTGSKPSPKIPLRTPTGSLQQSPQYAPERSFNAYGGQSPQTEAAYIALNSPSTPGGGRERLTSSTSVGSMSSTLRGNRAPAPAALDLSPRRRQAQNSARDRYGDVQGLMPPGDFGELGERRHVSDSSAWARTTTNPRRPLPHPPHSSSSLGLASTLAQPSLPPGAEQPRGPPRVGNWQTSVSSPINVPLSAVGSHVAPAAADRLSVRNDTDHLSPSPVTGFSPSSPETLDPANIDRRNLVGVGELATPRWGASPRHSRAPSIPGQSLSHSPNTAPESSRNWARGQTGLGLGVGVGFGQSVGMMEGVKEETAETRPRHHSVSHNTPPRNPSSAPAETDVTSLGSLADFDFDSNMTATLAESLGITREHRVSAPPPHTASAPPVPAPEHRSQPINQAPFSPPKVSPGSARSRIYARRASRQAAQSQNAPESPIYAAFTSANSSLDLGRNDSPRLSKFVEGPPRTRRTPPSSADSSNVPPGALRSRKKSNEGTPKSRQSPSSSHHDILKHFAPKDFSHLPPSPSSASINQFLRNSGSIHNFGHVPTGSYFVPPSSSKMSLQRSDSGRVRAARDGELALDADEALRKLDGLSLNKTSRTPKSKTSTGPQNVSSRPGTPPAKKPAVDKKLPSKPSSASLRAEAGDSPLQAWVDLTTEDIPDVPAIPTSSNRSYSLTAPAQKRESTSSTSFAESTSVQTSTPPTSTSGARFDKGGRRTSGGSEASAHSEASDQHVEKTVVVPPVPPLPKSYMSMRGVSASVTQDPVADPTPMDDLQSPKSVVSNVPSEASSGVNESGSTGRKPRMSKKWSFSSALNLNRHIREASAALTSPSAYDLSTISKEVAEPRGSQTPWTEIERPEISPTQPATGDTVTSQGSETRSNLSVTPVATGLQTALPKSGSKRLTPSSIPFFRRTSSSSFGSKGSLPRPEDTGVTRRPSGLSGRKASTTSTTMEPPPIPEQDSSDSQTPVQPKKTVFGMLKGSVGRRNKDVVVVENGEPFKSASTGWAGRKRGKTMSISNDALTKSSGGTTLRPKASVESSLSARGSAQSNHSESTVNAGTVKAPLPSIEASPVRQPLQASESTRDLPSITPTKIPRISNRPSGGSPHSGMPPPSMSLSKSAQFGSQGKKSSTGTSEMRPSISDFGTLNQTTPRQTGPHSHRNHLLAPMSARTEGQRKEKHREPLVRVASGQVVPPSRRHLPIPPAQNSTITAPTQSSLAKRASRENVPQSQSRPSLSRRESKETSSGVQTPSEQSSPIKTSRSAHVKLVPSSTSKLPSSSSTGVSGVVAKKALIPESPSMSPAEDEEALADGEMQAYVARRKARKAAGKKEDLTDINEFPEDTEPAKPQTQRAFISKRLGSMSDYERKEVLDFDSIYYCPPSRISRPTGSNGAIYNHGYDDERGDYIVVEGDHLCYRYEVGGVLGKGSFGQVVQCRDHQTGTSVAVKIIRNKKRFHAQALVEVKILQQLVSWDPDNKHNVVRMTDHFYFRGHLCIVTELLSINLYELIKANQFAGFSTTLIRRFTIQMLSSLTLMRAHRIVHCDLKPENILLCHPVKSGIKVIDFGSSCLETEKVYTYIQSRFYRSPEVILGMSYAMAIDMWSLGCILAELYTGVPIFPGENEQEQLACIMEVLGPPDRDIVNRSSRRKLFFDATGAPRPFVNAKGKRRRPSSKTLAQALKCNDELFVDFISKCLTWDPDRRLKPQPAMRHPWIVAGRRRHAASNAAPSSMRSVSKNLEASTNGHGHGHGHGHSHSGKDSSASSSLVGSAWNLSKSERRDRDKDKDKLLISPPTPLMARQSGSGSGSKVSGHGRNGSSSRINSSHLRNGSVNMIAAKVGLGT